MHTCLSKTFQHSLTMISLSICKSLYSFNLHAVSVLCLGLCSRVRQMRQKTKIRIIGRTVELGNLQTTYHGRQPRIGCTKTGSSISLYLRTSLSCRPGGPVPGYLALSALLYKSGSKTFLLENWQNTLQLTTNCNCNLVWPILQN